MKNCLFCQKFIYLAGDRGYSEMTPGYDATIRCSLLLWELDFYVDEEEDFRTKMLTAETCELFEEREEAP